MWISNIVFFVFGMWLLRRTARETASRFWRLPRWWPARLGGPEREGRAAAAALGAGAREADAV
jgi:hypothetical protein